MPKAGGAAQTVTLPATPNCVAADDTYAWVGTKTALYRVTLAGGAVSAVVSGIEIFDIAADATHVYARGYLDEKPGSRIVSWPKTGGAVKTLAQLAVGYITFGPSQRRMTIDATHGFYLDDDTLLKIPK